MNKGLARFIRIHNGKQRNIPKRRFGNLADLLDKHEETIKRWIQSGKFPNAYRNSDKEGWRVLESDLLKLNKVIPVSDAEQKGTIKPEVDTEGKGIHQNTIRSNGELYEYFKQYSKTFKQ
ncbi:hypothetical protein QIX46_18630 [Lysinibacillus boronitolerans]|nr:hypothetical protein QIX46_18630 [Lysinibacillus boronitolerans]